LDKLIKMPDSNIFEETSVISRICTDEIQISESIT
jgi:hypothetical protein